MTHFYKITVESTSDWYAVKLKSNGWWTKQKGETIDFNRGSENQFPSHMGLRLSDNELRLHKKQFDSKKTILKIQVGFECEMDSMDISIEKGDIGYVTISSENDSVTNKVNMPNNPHNKQDFTLRLGC